ncbi:MAG: 2-C-methyl-D-erythritol 4-phosphate cytidylyltransferase [Candidatus Cloacimonetes bacterium]|nr:2-C-methyl-D-erythritol 4-phosphate cytidylyltransferase [Candidatus Cloacimonadota bacterium]
MFITAIITAGGKGERLQASEKKQYLPLAGRRIIFRALDAFIKHPAVDTIVVVFPEDDLSFGRNLITAEYDYPFICVTGGETRQESVHKGLQACPKQTEVVLIHDAVRPFVRNDDIDKLLIKIESCVAVIPGSPVVNTIKKVKNGIVSGTIDREKLYNIHTPQVFRYSLITNCHKRAAEANLSFTDDAGLIEHFGYPVAIVETENNIKITKPIDIIIAESLIKLWENKHDESNK